MTNNDPRTRFLELEQEASDAVQQLERLRQETQHYDEASRQLAGTAEEVRGLINSLQGVAGVLKDLVSGLQEAGVPVILERIEALESQLAEVRRESHDGRIGTDNRLDAIMEYLSKGFLGRMFGKPKELSSRH
jgi:chromosome segregation ATPase